MFGFLKTLWFMAMLTISCIVCNYLGPSHAMRSSNKHCMVTPVISFCSSAHYKRTILLKSCTWCMVYVQWMYLWVDHFTITTHTNNNLLPKLHTNPSCCLSSKLLITETFKELINATFVFSPHEIGAVENKWLILASCQLRND